MFAGSKTVSRNRSGLNGKIHRKIRSDFQRERFCGILSAWNFIKSVVFYLYFVSYALNSVLEYSLGEMWYFWVNALEK